MTHADPVPDPTARLTAAATHLRTLITAVPPPPWALGGIGDYGWTVHMGNPAAGPYESLDTRMDSDEGKALARFITAMGPLVGALLATLLETEARVEAEDRAALADESRAWAAVGLATPERAAELAHESHGACTPASCTTEAALALADAILTGADQ